MLISKLNPDNLTDEQMTNLLYGNLDDDNQKVDCIFVFGSSKAVQSRLPKAIQLYREGRATKILFSGGVTWNGQEFPEAILLRNKAIEYGVPEKDILIEAESKHTKENVIASLLILDRLFDLHKIKRILIVTSSYHMRRTYLTLRTYMPGWIEYSMCPVDDQTTRVDNWFSNYHGRGRVVNESKKLIKYVKEGIIINDHI